MTVFSCLYGRVIYYTIHLVVNHYKSTVALALKVTVSSTWTPPDTA